MIAPFAHHFFRTLAQSPSLRSIILDVAALSVAALHDARFCISDFHHTIPGYVALVFHAFTINALNRVTQRLTLNFPSPDILRLSSSSPRLYSPFLSMSLEELYPSFYPPYSLSPSYLSCCSSCSHPPSQAAPVPLLIYPHISQLSSTHPSSHHHSLDIGHDLTSVSFLLSIMHSSQASPACDDRVTFLIPKYYYSPTSASSLHLQSPARYSTSYCSMFRSR